MRLLLLWSWLWWLLLLLSFGSLLTVGADCLIVALLGKCWDSLAHIACWLSDLQFLVSAMLPGLLSADDDVTIDNGAISVLIRYSYINRLIQFLEGIVGMRTCYKVAWLRCCWFVIVWCKLVWLGGDIRAVLISELFWLLLLLVLFACLLCWLCLRQIVDSLRIIWSLNVKP